MPAPRCNALNDVESAIAAGRVLETRVRSLSGAFDEQPHALELTETSLRVGRADRRALEQQRLSAANARIALLGVRAEQLAQRVNLHLALGGSFEPAAATAAAVSAMAVRQSIEIPRAALRRRVLPALLLPVRRAARADRRFAFHGGHARQLHAGGIQCLHGAGRRRRARPHGVVISAGVLPDCRGAWVCVSRRWTTGRAALFNWALLLHALVYICGHRAAAALRVRARSPGRATGCGAPRPLT